MQNIMKRGREWVAIRHKKVPVRPEVNFDKFNIPKSLMQSYKFFKLHKPTFYSNGDFP